MIDKWLKRILVFSAFTLLVFFIFYIACFIPVALTKFGLLPGDGACDWSGCSEDASYELVVTMSTVNDNKTSGGFERRDGEFCLYHAAIVAKRENLSTDEIPVEVRNRMSQLESWVLNIPFDLKDSSEYYSPITRIILIFTLLPMAGIMSLLIVPVLVIYDHIVSQVRKNALKRLSYGVLAADVVFFITFFMLLFDPGLNGSMVWVTGATVFIGIMIILGLLTNTLVTVITGKQSTV